MTLLLSAQLNVADFIILAFLLIFAVYGLIRGFLKQIMGLLSTVAAFVCAYLFCDKLANLLMERTSAGTSIAEWIQGFFDENWNVEKSVSELSAFITSQNWPTFLSEAVIKAVESLGSATVNFAEVAGTTIAKYILVSVSFMAISLVCKLVFILVEKLLSFIVNHTPIKIADKILGVALGVAKGYLIVSLVLFVIGLFSFEPMKDFKAVLDESVISDFFMKYNVFAWLLGKIM